MRSRLLGQFKPLYLFGDSHCLPLRDACLEVGEAGERFVIRSHYVSGFRAKGLDTKCVDAAIMKVLRAFNLLDEDGRPRWKAADAGAINEAFAAGVAMHPPLLVMCCGDIDVRSHIFRQLGTSFDVAGEGPTVASKIIPTGEVRKMLAERLGRIPLALRRLQEFGFPQAHLMMLPPPYMGDDAFEAMHGYRCPLPVRARLITLANSLLAEICAKERVGFVDFEQTVATGGALKAQFFLDGVHASIDTAPFMVDALFEQAGEISPRNRQDNVSLYRVAEAQGAKQSSSKERFAKAGEAFKRDGICTIDIPRDFVARLSAELVFDKDVGNRHVNIDWVGNSAKALSSNMRCAVPNDAALEAVHRLFFDDGFAGVFHAGVDREVYFVNCRPLQSIAHDGQGAGPQAFHRDGCPPGLYRALIYLTDVDEETGAFEYQNGDGKPVRVTGRAGTLVFFDANRLLHRGSPPRKGMRQVIDLCVLIRPERMPARVIWSGMNNWPKDPFNYSVYGMKAWPPFECERVSLHPLPDTLTAADAASIVREAAREERPAKRVRLRMPKLSRMFGTVRPSKAAG